MKNNEHFMQLAIEVARRNPNAPFGAILVDSATQTVVAQGLNRAKSNPIMHGEMDAMDQYANSDQNQWSRLRLYTTGEPCCMCQSAIIWAGIPEVVFGTSVETLIGLGWNQFQLTAADVVASARFAQCNIVGGVLEQECDQLFVQAGKLKS